MFTLTYLYNEKINFLIQEIQTYSNVYEKN